jgi:hypothetical protein
MQLITMKGTFRMSPPGSSKCFAEEFSSSTSNPLLNDHPSLISRNLEFGKRLNALELQVTAFQDWELQYEAEETQWQNTE